MRSSFRVFTFLGIPVTLHWSLFLLVGFYALAYGATILPVVGIIFASVLAHEYGHALVARRFYRIPCNEIQLNAMGGIAMIAGLEELENNHKGSIAIAAAGPGVSFALAGLGLLGALFINQPGVSAFCYILLACNLMIGTFNLLPFYPMDGGRILRSGLSLWLGSRRAIPIARVVAYVGAAGLAAAAFVLTWYSLLIVVPLIVWFNIQEQKHGGIG